MDAHLFAVAHPNLVGYKVGYDYWIFTPSHFRPSYWLLLKREGFSGDLAGGSSELDHLAMYFGRDELETIYSIHDTPPDRWFEFSLRDDLEHLILSGNIKVFKVNEHTAGRLANIQDPIYSNPMECTGHAFSDKRNELSEELAKDILVRWIGKDKSDKVHWDRWAIERGLVEVYDVGAEVVDTAVDLVVGLWDIGKFVVSIVGSSIELTFDITMAAAQFHAKLVSGDFEGVKKDLKALGIAAEEAWASAEAFKAKVTQGYTMFTQLKEDPLTRELFLDYFSSLYQSIPYRDSRTIGVRIVSEVGIEVLLALATAGSGNLARRAAQAGAQGAKALKASRIGPFTAHAIDLMADLSRTLRQATSKKADTSGTKWVNGNRGWESVPAERQSAEPFPPSRSKSTDPEIEEGSPDSHRPTLKPVSSFDEAEERLSQAREAIQQRKAAGLPLYQPKYSDEQLLDMVNSGATANDRFLVSIQPKNSDPNAKLSYQRESGLVPTWTTSFDQLEAADKDPELIHKVLGAESNYDPNKEYVMHIIDRGENLDNFGQSTIVPTWDNLANASVRELGELHNPDTIRQTMNSDYQAEYAEKMQALWDTGSNEFKEKDILEFADTMNDSEADLFLARHSIRTEIGANSEFTGNGLTANTAKGGGSYGVIETLSLERNLPNLSQLQNDGIVKSLDLAPL